MECFAWNTVVGDVPLTSQPISMQHSLFLRLGSLTDSRNPVSIVQIVQFHVLSKPENENRFSLWRGISENIICQGRPLDLSICTSLTSTSAALDSRAISPYDIHLCAKVKRWCSSIRSWTLLICTNPNQTGCKHLRCKCNVAYRVLYV